MSIRLIVEEDGRRTPYDFQGEVVGIGRTADNTIRIKSSQSSRKHCLIRRTDEGYVVEDLKSRNGTNLNGEPIRIRALTVGDRIEIGDTIIHFGERADGGERPSSARRHSARASGSKSSTRRGAKPRSERRSARRKRGPEAAPRPQAFALEVLNEPARGLIPIKTFPFMIGRQGSNALILDHDGVSPEHCMIVPAEKGLFLVDLGSVDGTLINGEKVSRELVEPGQIIGIGSVRLRIADGRGDAPEPTARPKARPKPAYVVEEVSDLDALEESEEEEAPPTIPEAAVAEPFASSGPSSDRTPPAALDEADFLGASLTQIDMARVEEVKSKSSWMVPVQVGGVVVILGVVLTAALAILPRLVITPDLDPDLEGNLAVNWSFEQPRRDDGSIPGWRLQKKGPGVAMDAVKRARYGRKALEAKLGDGSQALVLSEEPIRLAAGGIPAEVRGVFEIEDAAVAGLQVQWLDERDAQLGVALVGLLAEPGEGVVEGFAAPPEGASKARLMAFVRGRGVTRALIDRLEFRQGEAGPAPVELKRPTGLVRLSPRGVASFTRPGGRGPLARDIRLSLVVGDTAAFQDFGGQDAARLDVPAQVKKRRARSQGALFDSDEGAWRPFLAFVEDGESGLRFRYQFEGRDLPSSAYLGIGLVCPDPSAVAPVLVVNEGGGSSRLSELFAKGGKGEEVPIAVPGVREVSWGEGARQVAMRLTGPATLVAARGGSGLDLRFFLAPQEIEGELRSVGFELSSSSSKERGRIRQLFDKAGAASAAADYGRALGIYRQIEASYGYDAAVVARARKRAESLEAIARDLSAEIQRAVEDAKSLGSPLIRASAEARLAKLERAFPASLETGAAQRAIASLRTRAEADAATEKSLQASRILARGNKHLAASRLQLARAIFRHLVDNYPADDASVREAKVRLKNLEAP